MIFLNCELSKTERNGNPNGGRKPHFPSSSKISNVEVSTSSTGKSNLQKRTADSGNESAGCPRFCLKHGWMTDMEPSEFLSELSWFECFHRCTMDAHTWSHRNRPAKGVDSNWSSKHVKMKLICTIQTTTRYASVSLRHPHCTALRGKAPLP